MIETVYNIDKLLSTKSYLLQVQCQLSSLKPSRLYN